MRVLVRTDDETELQRNELSRGRRRRVYARRRRAPKNANGPTPYVPGYGLMCLRAYSEAVADGLGPVGDGLSL
ncbi:hypothetical protein HanHA300_Chr12g0428751 [Helianthus annuus]|nr:hypothetical protein HanHA300_Chr12g0428751 [Helianthus annuus]KAJ0503849.1 hypothetical protein HanHA89_Chr12g0452891 [Helianthus annuus]KAJ0673537.1 hypothetical protein HanLR1_Chr12g0430271 [Helianthus annuus]